MTTLGTYLPHKPTMLKLTLWLIGVYADDFIGMEKNPPRKLLRHIARAIIILIHEVFVPPTCQDTQAGNQQLSKSSLKANAHGAQKMRYWDGYSML